MSAMGFRFRRTIPLGRLFRINVSKTGVSVSAGRPGATVNVGKDGTHVTVGAPGTGMSWREKVTSRGCAPVLLVTLLVIAFASL
ncbi:MAG: hypothetical protein RL646_1244 [Verrucomicrobiota bacterium]|jgi:hypothetical protein